LGFKNTDIRIFRLLKKLCKSKGIRKYIALLELLNLLSDHKDFHLLLKQTMQPLTGQHKDDKYERLLRFIYSNFNELPTLSNAANYVGMNNSALCRYLKDKYKTTYTSLVNEVKIEQACLLLTETNLTISQVCFECGFSSPSYFHRVFKKIKNSSPKEYRNNLLLAMQ